MPSVCDKCVFLLCGVGGMCTACGVCGVCVSQVSKVWCGRHVRYVCLCARGVVCLCKACLCNVCVCVIVSARYRQKISHGPKGELAGMIFI